MFHSTTSLPNFNDVLTSCQLDSGAPLLDTRTIRHAFAEAECDFGYQEHTVFDMNTTIWAFLHEMMHTGTGRTLQAAARFRWEIARIVLILVAGNGVPMIHR